MNAKSYTSQKGFISVLSVLILSIFAATLFMGIQIVLVSQKRLALQHRLQICVLKSTARHAKFLNGLRSTNKLMEPLRMTVIALRTARLAPGVGTVVVSVAEKLAYRSLKTLELKQESDIKHMRVKNLMASRCPSTKYSNESIFCRQPLVKRSIFHRKRTAFKDVPGHLSLRNSISKTFQPECRSLSLFSRISKTSTILFGDRTLTWNKLSYAFTK